MLWEIGLHVCLALDVVKKIKNNANVIIVIHSVVSIQGVLLINVLQVMCALFARNITQKRTCDYLVVDATDCF
tara:strand:+ start:435 stop:653 length:219 start_codon:yes stop_codon:yes gene_type:complete